ncbi:MAG: citrate:proton symporter [Clostridiales bacterium]|nr:citrate:proton symporter [Clostridiales bacterium]
MLAILGFLTVILLLAAVMSKKLSPTAALISVPLVMGVIASFFIKDEAGVTNVLANIKALSGHITGAGGIGSVAATGVMFIFSILFFGVLTDAGTFRPIIRGILKVIGRDPVKITLGTAVLAMIVHLDGSGAVTFLICIPALLPLYDALHMRRTTLASVAAMAAGVMNIMPWGGPTIRAAAAMGVDVMVLFKPLIIPVVIGLLAVLTFAFILGRGEKKRMVANDAEIAYQEETLSPEAEALLRPKLFIVNILLILAAVAALLFSGFAPAVIFMIAFVLAMVINYPKPSQQAERVDAHAKEALMMASVLFAAGAFTGIMKGTGMIDAMAKALVAVIPQSMGRFFPVITGVLGMPASLLFDPDSFYYGVLPVLATTAESFGISGLSIARAAVLGQMTTGFPVSPLTAATFLLTGLAGVDLGEHQKKTIPLAFALTLIMLLAALLLGAVEW